MLGTWVLVAVGLLMLIVLGVWLHGERGVPTVNWEACMGCGVCVGKCPSEAVQLVRDERKGVPLDVRLLAQEQAM